MRDHDSSPLPADGIGERSLAGITCATASADADCEQASPPPVTITPPAREASKGAIPQRIRPGQWDPGRTRNRERSGRNRAADTTSSRFLLISGMVILLAGFAAGQVLGPLMACGLFWLFAALTRLRERSTGPA
jgi:hypothetical protein